MTAFRAALLLLLATAAAYSPRLTSVDWRGTEGRRVQIAMEMRERIDQGVEGAWVVPTLGWEPTFAKPPLYYWVLATAGNFAGFEVWSMRVPSVLSLWLVASLIWVLMRRGHGERGAWVAALLTLASPVLLYDGALAEIDPMFGAFTAGCILCLGAAVERSRPWLGLAAGLLGGAAFLIKGPPMLLFLGPATVFALWRGGWRAVLLMLPPLLVLPATYFAVLLQVVDREEYLRVVQAESVGRITTFELRHYLETPLYLLRAAAVTLPGGLWWLAQRWRRRQSGAPPIAAGVMVQTCAVGALFGVVILAFFPGRATRYLLPMLPLAAVAFAPWVVRWLERVPGTVPSRSIAVAGVLGAVALVVAPFLPPPFPGRSIAYACAFGLAPFLVRTRAALFGAAFVLPAIGVWTAVLDYEEHRAAGSRGVSRNAALLRSELEARGLSGGDASLATWGHLNSGLLIGLGVVPRGDEMRAHEPRAQWVLAEDTRAVPLGEVSGYAERVRVSWRDREWVLLERER